MPSLLALILGLKFLTAKMLALLMLMAGTAFWFLLGQQAALALPPPPGMV